MKMKFFGKILLFSLLVFFSCKNDSNKNIPTAILNFYLTSTDTNSAIDQLYFFVNIDTFFTYNNVDYDGFIQNRDSLPYGTNLTRVIPKITTYATSGLSTSINDTIIYTEKDTVDFTKPVKVRIIVREAPDSFSLYLTKVNVHKVDHELFGWETRTYPTTTGSLSGEKAVFFGGRILLFQNVGGETKLSASADALSWQTKAVSGLSADAVDNVIAGKTGVFACDGTQFFSSKNGETFSLAATSENLYCLLFEHDGAVFAMTDDGKILKTADLGATWQLVADAPDGFPVAGFSCISAPAPSGKSRYAIVGGTALDGTPAGVWSTEDGAYWVNLSAGRDTLAASQSAALYYDYKLYLFGGENSGVLTSDVFVSENFGLSWQKLEEKLFPNALKTCLNPSVLTDGNHRIFLLGGRTPDGVFLKQSLSGRKVETYFDTYR